MWRVLICLLIGGIFFTIVRTLVPIDPSEVSMNGAIISDLVAGIILGGAYYGLAELDVSRSDLAQVFFIYLGANIAGTVIPIAEGSDIAIAIMSNFFSTAILTCLYVWQRASAATRQGAPAQQTKTPE